MKDDGFKVLCNNKDMLIGAVSINGSLAWPGKIDEIKIYKRVLSSDEVKQLYSSAP